MGNEQSETKLSAPYVWTVKLFDRMTAPELYGILRLRGDVFVVEQHCPYPDLDGKDQEALHIWAGTPGGDLVAYARVLPPGKHFAGPAVGRVAIPVPYRGRGLAHDLVGRAVAEARAGWPGKSVYISAQVYLTEFYQSHGFAPISEAYLEDGIPHIDMVLNPS